MKSDTFYFPHDFNARNDRKLIKVHLKFKMSGIGIFWSLIEMMYEENGKLPVSEIPTIAAHFREKESTVLSVINDFDLFKNDGNFFWSESVKHRMLKRLEKSEKAKASASHRWQNANAMRTHTDRNAIKERKGKENKGKEIERGSNGADAPTPKSFKVFSEDDFKQDIARFKSDYHTNLLRDFYKYWSEKSASGKMKFQLEDTWETSKRLDTWQRNEDKFSKNGSVPEKTTSSNLHTLKKI